ncbi:Neuronal acetylcholine receptor subunit alpha-9-II [Mizuhopecten yessoensis]|uniref:Neuronal acetylcholine receptor subunit alpha-9-II n=1 Tax=Mizuhopecten yessoensis TaxID=6573 RepID=A0A210QQT2_MIZYE|nr:Neuronal acetylcholine receptor subunit alpha-9-II [Mizuhopecten yessoensis]
MVEGFNILEGVLGTHLTFTLQWTDEFIRWVSEEYDNITVINLPHLDVWVPQMVLLNPSSDNFGFLIKEKDMLLVQYTSEGFASLTFATYFESTCQPSLRQYPFDSHTCHLNISHVGYSIGEVISVPLHVYDKRKGDSGPWDVGAVELTANLLIPGVAASRYAELSMQLSRRPSVLLLNLIFPIFIQMIMNVFVFYLPAECGEKASYSITVFLAVEIFMTIIMDQLPPSSSETPFLNVILFMHLINTAVLCAMTTVSLLFYHRSNTIIIPERLRRFTIRMSLRHGDILTGQPPENMSQMTERVNRDITETDDITHHAAVSAGNDRRRVFLTWQSQFK